MDGNPISLHVINADNNLNDFFLAFIDCQSIIEENLIENGGTLRKSNLIDEDYQWSFLVVAKKGKNVIGFSLVRFSEINQHNVADGGYFYLSQIAVSKFYQKLGIGSLLLTKTLQNCNEYPLVASVRKDNIGSIKLFSKFMIAANQKGDYIRFVDKEYERSKKERI